MVAVRSTGGGYKWRLYRNDSLVLISRDSFPTRSSAEAAARHEMTLLREIQVQA